MYPKDGLCDYIFYTDVYIYNIDVTSTKVLRSFEMFKTKIKQYSLTEGGVSFDIRYIDKNTIESKRSALTNLRANRIQHYGCLNMIAPTTILDNWVTKATDVFRAFKEIQGNDTSTKTVIALGTWGSGIQATWTSFKQLVEKATEASFKADIVISISSTHMLHNITSCFAVPPAIINSNKDLYPSLVNYIMNITRWPRFALLVYNVHMADITKGCGYGDPFYLLEDMKRALKS